MVPDVVLMSVASQLALALCVYIGWRALNRRPDLAARLAAVREYSSRKARVECARVALERSVAERAALGRLLDRARQVVRDVDGQQLTIEGIGFVLVSLVLFEGDNALMTLLNGGSAMFGMRFEGWAIGSPWIVAAVFMGLHMLVSMAIADPNRPARTRRLARLGALSTGVLVFGAMWASLSGRGADFGETGWAGDAIQWSLWILAGVLAVCGGFTTVLATESLRQARLAERVIELETRDEEYVRCIATLEREIEIYGDSDMDDHGGSTGSSRLSNVARNVAALCVVLLIGGVGPAAAGVTAGALSVHDGVAVGTDQAGANAKAMPSWLTQDPAPVRDECDILLDVSNSTAKPRRVVAAKQLASVLPSILGVRGCRIVRLSAFSGDGPLQTLNEFTLPAWPPHTSCETPASGGTSLAQLMYPDLQRIQRRKAHADCQSKQATAAAAAEQLWRSAVGSIGERLISLADTPPVGRCTPLYQTTLRAVHRSQHVVVASDGHHTCRWYQREDGSPWSQAVPPLSSLVFVLLPHDSEIDDAVGEAAERAAAVLRIFPGAVVRLLNEATESYWQRPLAPPVNAPRRE